VVREKREREQAVRGGDVAEAKWGKWKMKKVSDDWASDWIYS
jgi:hypothetical protein